MKCHILEFLNIVFLKHLQYFKFPINQPCILERKYLGHVVPRCLTLLLIPILRSTKVISSKSVSLFLPTYLKWLSFWFEEIRYFKLFRAFYVK